MIVYHLITEIFPLVKQELGLWKKKAGELLAGKLREQAMESIQCKSFHCLGGSVYALYPGVNTQQMIKFIVAYQTLSDFLDNLVDNMGIQDERSFAQLHLAMTEALIPFGSLSPYYLYYPTPEDDRGYIEALVQTCRAALAPLPSLAVVKPHLLMIADHYSHLQTYKHLEISQRKEKLDVWLAPMLPHYPVSKWELAAATGSTLGIFALVAAGYHPSLPPRQGDHLLAAYLPWVCGLHILLDYLIDLWEDERTEQFNFVRFYQTNDAALSGLSRILENAQRKIEKLSYPDFHRTVIQGLLSMYLSDPKVQRSTRSAQTNQIEIGYVAHHLVGQGGLKVQAMHWLCWQLRKARLL